MNKKIKMLVLCLVCLSLGTLIYLLTRPDAYISIVVYKLFKFKNMKTIVFPFVSFYIPDYLWGVALCSCLNAVCPYENTILWGVITFLYGTLWECLQLFSLVNGTADIIDVSMYLLAAITVILINYNFKKEVK